MKRFVFLLAISSLVNVPEVILGLVASMANTIETTQTITKKLETAGWTKEEIEKIIKHTIKTQQISQS